MTEPDPDQLLKSLEASTAMLRAKHSGRGSNRNTFRMMSIMIIVIGVVALLGVMEYMASELSAHKPAPKGEAGQPASTETK